MQISKNFHYFLANPKGINICWNSDYHTYWNTTSTSAEQHVLPLLKPGLEVEFNIPKRQEYCAKNGLIFDLGAALAPHMVQPGMVQPGMVYQPPYYPSQNLQAFPMNQSGFPAAGYSGPGGYTTGYGNVVTAPPEYKP